MDTFRMANARGASTCTAAPTSSSSRTGAPSVLASCRHRSGRCFVMQQLQNEQQQPQHRGMVGGSWKANAVATAPGAAAKREKPAVAAPAPVNMEISGLKHLPEEARERAQHKKASKFEKVKVEKCGSRMWTEVHELASALRTGETEWKDLNLDDIDVRMKWAGMFHRAKRAPQTFMVRIKVPNGEATSAQMRCLAGLIRPYGDNGCGDITTRAAFQLRGVKLEDADKVVKGLHSVNMTSFQTGMDNVRNLTGNPIAGIDPHELIDTRPLCYELQDMITNGGMGREDLVNLPRKINVCISSTRDDFPHTHINDVGFEAVRDPESGELLFNLVLGGYFSLKRNMVSIPSNIAVREDQVVRFTEALLQVFRDHGLRQDRQKARLIWLIEEIGMEKFLGLIAQYMGVGGFKPAVHVNYEDDWKRRDLLGVHPQKQEGYSWVGACVPAGRITADDYDAFADIADKYGDGTVRLTCEENILWPNIPNDKVEAMLREPLFQKFKVENTGPLMHNLVSCTGSQFCGFALIETKNRAMAVIRKLEDQLDIPRGIRIHWTGCPNSCGQAQVADIGLMGMPAKLNGKAVEGVKIFLGGKIGEGAALAEQFDQGVPCNEEILLPKLTELLVNNFGAKPKEAAAVIA